MEFNPDGSWNIQKSAPITKETEYLLILKAITDLPFPVGKSLLVDFVSGFENNKTIISCNLYNNKSFGCLAYSKDEVDFWISKLITKGMIRQVASSKNKYWKILEITKKGSDEMINPTLDKETKRNIVEHKTIITDKEKAVFQAFGSILESYNDYQKKGIISNAKNILCIAGAGSGKTTVLTKRIEFLIKFKSINQDKILALTFTRKARREMEQRLNQNGIFDVQIETFNSFCEKILKKYNDLIYSGLVNVLSYKDKIILINRALTSVKQSMNSALVTYFSPQQRRGKTKEQLTNIFRNDCFFVRDYLKFKGGNIDDIAINKLEINEQRSAKLIFSICKFLDAAMKRANKRDFADQIVDALKFFKTSPEYMPKFDHILVDEFQDVNGTQIDLIDTLNPKNRFTVGDPRQSIYGWRGSDIKYILDYKEKAPDAEIICLNKNYRSSPSIVELFNESIKHMGMNNLESTREHEKDIKLLNFKSEREEFAYVIKKIQTSEINRNEIFVLGRTNKLLNRFGDALKANKIKYHLRSEESNNALTENTSTEKITLSTVHAIKGLEAEQVFVIGANSNSFPCRASEHPIMELVKIEEYDKEEEEKRLFYVAISRAKNNLMVTYTGIPTYFITARMKILLDNEKDLKGYTKDIQVPLKGKYQKNKTKNTYTKTKKTTTSNGTVNETVSNRLKRWRQEQSQALNIPAYFIMHNSVVDDLARNMPLTIEDLESIKGLGPVKIQKYGRQILNCII